MKVIICDDNLQEQKRYTAMLEKLAAKHNVPLELSRYETATSLLFDAQDPKFTAELIFMDIHMPNMNGDEAARRLRENGYVNDIVFLTISQKHFRDAFDVQALHYVVKNETTESEFEKIFLRALQSQNEKKQKYVSYSGGGETRNILLNSIRYFEIYRGIVKVYYDKEHTFEFPQKTLSELENELSEYGFFKTHKSYLVSLTSIEKITYTQITLRDGTKIPLSRHKYAELKSLFTAPSNEGGE